MLNVEEYLANCPPPFRPDQCPRGLQFLLGKAAEIDPKTYLEVGCGKLVVLEVFSSLLSANGLAIGVDHRPYETWGDYKNPWNVRTKIVLAPSMDTETPVKIEGVLEGRQVDVLFIDGDHSVPYVEWDWATYSPLVRPGGLVIFHDYDPSPEAIDPGRDPSLLMQQGPTIVCSRLAEQGYKIHIVPNTLLGTSYLYQR